MKHPDGEGPLDPKEAKERLKKFRADKSKDIKKGSDLDRLTVDDPVELEDEDE